MTKNILSEKLEKKLKFIANRTYCQSILHLTVDNIDSDEVNSIEEAIFNAMKNAIEAAEEDKK